MFLMDRRTLDRSRHVNLLLRAARTQRCAGEGELISELTKHGVILPKGGPF